MEYAAQHSAEVGLTTAADRLDSVGAKTPDDGDLGEAAAVVASIVATFTEAAASLVTEAKVLALGIRVASTDMAQTDAEQAVDFIQVGQRR